MHRRTSHTQNTVAQWILRVSFFVDYFVLKTRTNFLELLVEFGESSEFAWNWSTSALSAFSVLLKTGDVELDWFEGATSVMIAVMRYFLVSQINTSNSSELRRDKLSWNLNNGHFVPLFSFEIFQRMKKWRISNFLEIKAIFSYL